MAQITFDLRLDDTPVMLAAHELAEVVSRLASRHGDRFRRLERRIEALVDVEWTDTLTTVGAGNFVVRAPPEWTAILTDARALGVLA